MVSPRASAENISIINDIAGNQRIIRVDELRLKQVLVNLLSNAVKFSHPGGEVRLSAAFEAGESFCIAIADNGIGMDENGVAKAKSRFGQAGDTHNANDGAGLGLPLSIGLVELHGGALEIESEAGVGTTVTIRLPVERLVREN